MSPLEAVVILLAGLAAGTINTIVGSGSLITFPTLLAFGYPPVVANVSNTVGLVPGSISGAVGYRSELAGQRQEVTRLGVVAAAGGLSGAILLLALPPTSFQRIVRTWSCWRSFSCSSAPASRGAWPRIVLPVAGRRGPRSSS